MNQLILARNPAKISDSGKYSSKVFETLGLIGKLWGVRLG
jgi:hypothetical protein